MASQGAGMLRYTWGYTEGLCSGFNETNPLQWEHYGVVRDNFAYHFLPPNVVSGPYFAPGPSRGGTTHSTEISIVSPDGLELLLVKSFVAALEPGKTYCSSVTVCAMPTADLVERCVNATTRQIVVDNTPPSATCHQPHPVEDSGPTLEFDVRVACSDPQSGIVSASLSLGTFDNPTLFLATLQLDISNDDVADASAQGAVFSNTTAAASDNFIISDFNRAGFDGFLRVTDDMLERQPADGEQLIATLLCYNPLGLYEQSRSFLPLVWDATPPATGFLHIEVSLLITTYHLLLTTYCLLLTTYCMLLTAYSLLLTTCCLLLTTHYSQLTTHCLLFSIYYLLVTAYYMLLTAYCLLLTTCYLLLTTYYLLLTT